MGRRDIDAVGGGDVSVERGRGGGRVGMGGAGGCWGEGGSRG